MTDRFQHQKSQLESAAQDGFAIVPNDTTVFDQPTRAIYIGQAGDLTVKMLGYDGVTHTTLTFTAVSAGTVIPIRVVAVLATGTTADLILGLF